MTKEATEENINEKIVDAVSALIQLCDKADALRDGLGGTADGRQTTVEFVASTMSFHQDEPFLDTILIRIGDGLDSVMNRAKTLSSIRAKLTAEEKTLIGLTD
jgi:hypothetical protein